MSKRRVVITGMGCVTSLGLNVDSVWEKIVAGTSGIGPITRFDTSEHTVKIGGQVSNWDSPNIESRVAKRMDRFSQFALNAAIDATNDAGIDFKDLNPWRCGAIIGTGIGGIEEFEDGYRKMIDKGPSRVSPFMVPKLMCNAGAGNVSIHFGLKGPNAAVATACASAGHAIGEAVDAIRNDAADVMISGGSEAAMTPLGVACFIALKALSKRNDDPTRASRPFDKDRDGFVLAEGAGILLLEEYEHAKARGAKIYGELMGYGSTCDGSHITAPLEDGAGASYAMKQALKDSGLNTDQIGYINAHGTSTGLGDIAETRAVKKLFGERAYQIPVNSTKSMTGHLLGASGGVEAIWTTKALQTGILPPTINLDCPDEQCDLDYIPNVAREKQVQYGMSNSFGFGGHNISLVIGTV
ncbi:MAG TPA: beta-ketoacyl-[acyl-carrier-protein] synthase II [Phycisphaerales bacterium]|mgnify:CR=1 FL=1|nr:beta-ketoacyl-[acyl-carrier-protein] synthase II [Phycisphaerales bacterium]HCD32687.1 beta-ketoacyl-[acyl-carrier-protein] synthase II [Phycisphaerales bacterium]|tara:strand:- start:70367 stop:71602 length:1236 start_codon:yes stop_codon:yes gene_type:complete